MEAAIEAGLPAAMAVLGGGLLSIDPLGARSTGQPSLQSRVVLPVYFSTSRRSQLPEHSMKTFTCVVLLGLSLGACSYTSDTVVQKPAPTTSSTTYVTPDSASPTGASSTTVYRTN